VKTIVKMANSIDLYVEEGYFTTLGKEWYIPRNERFQSWELVRLIAQQGNNLVTQIVKQADKSPVQEDWINCQHTLEQIVDSIVYTLKFLEDHCRMVIEFRAKDFSELEQMYGSMQSFKDTLGEVWESYMANAETAEELAAEMFVQVRDARKKTGTHLESRKDHA
jgi:hypothetical protein